MFNYFQFRQGFSPVVLDALVGLGCSTPVVASTSRFAPSFALPWHHFTPCGRGGCAHARRNWRARPLRARAAERRVEARVFERGRGPGLGGPFIGGKSRFAAKRVVQYICTLHFCTSSTRCWTVLCSSSSCVRLSKSRWTAGKIETCRCTGRQRPAAGVARRVQTRQWSRRERAADAAT